MKGSDIRLSPVQLGSKLTDQVWELYRKNSATLGFLPRGALDEFAHSGCVLAAVVGHELAGYIAWRRSRGEAILVHLCVSKDFRSTSCSNTLLHGMFEQCRDDAAIRLRCRKDYVEANRIWPRYGFTVTGEQTGRGSDTATLLMWRRPNPNAIQRELALGTRKNLACIIAMDANVFFDVLEPGSVHHEESSALLADWLDDADVAVTCEIRNEVARQIDSNRRKATFAEIQRFNEIAANPDHLESALTAISTALPPPVTDSDHSDRRQLAHAWKGGAAFFATRDSIILSHADDLCKVTGLMIMRPTDIVARLQGDILNIDYAPVRIQGTHVERRTVASEEELLSFQAFSSGESKPAWLKTIRSARAALDRCSVEVINVRGEAPCVAVSVDRSHPNTIYIRFLRSMHGPLTGTLLRRVLADTIESAREQHKYRVIIDDPGPGEIRDALSYVGFEIQENGQLARYTLQGLVSIESSRIWIREHIPQASIDANQSAVDLEARFWPLKVTDAGIQTFLVPIRSYWAAALFDRRLASEDLFGVPAGPALALENVYYSASNILIPEGSRILWYVSGKHGAVRAISNSLGTDTDTATRLSRRYHRLGVYCWRNILSAASQNPEDCLHAYRFARTELLGLPIEWKRLEELIWNHMGTRNRLVSPLRIPESLFEAIYREGMGMST